LIIWTEMFFELFDFIVTIFIFSEIHFIDLPYYQTKHVSNHANMKLGKVRLGRYLGIL